MRVTCAFWKSHWLQCGGTTGEGRGFSWGNQLGNNWNRSGLYSDNSSGCRREGLHAELY